MSAPVIVGMIVGAVVVGGVAISVTSQLEARHRVDAVAQNAALAAADSHFGWVNEEPCRLAREIAERSETHLLTCEIGHFDVVVSVRVRTLMGERIGVARAGVDGTHLG